MTKAQEKEQKELRSRLTALLNRTLVDFQDKYLGAYVSWNISQLERDLERAKKNAKTPNDEYYVAVRATKLARKSLLTLEFITEAKVGYDQKFNKLVENLMKFEMRTAHMEVKQINSMGSELSFLIVNHEMEVHARAIFVNGDIKAPHYRFIVTKRNK